MDWIRNLPPAQRTALMVGVPIVALVVLVQLVRRPAAAPAATDDTTTTPTGAGTTGQTLPYVVSDGAIGVGELGTMITTLTQGQARIGTQLEAVRTAITTGETGQPAAPAGTMVTVRAGGETWRQILVRHYSSTNPWTPVKTARANATLIARYPTVDSRLPAGAVVFMPARNW